MYTGLSSGVGGRDDSDSDARTQGWQQWRMEDFREERDLGGREGRIVGRRDLTFLGLVGDDDAVSSRHVTLSLSSFENLNDGCDPEEHRRVFSGDESVTPGRSRNASRVDGQHLTSPCDASDSAFAADLITGPDRMSSVDDSVETVQKEHGPRDTPQCRLRVGGFGACRRTVGVKRVRDWTKAFPHRKAKSSLSSGEEMPPRGR